MYFAATCFVYSIIIHLSMLMYVTLVYLCLLFYMLCDFYNYPSVVSLNGLLHYSYFFAILTLWQWIFFFIFSGAHERIFLEFAIEFAGSKGMNILKLGITKLLSKVIVITFPFTISMWECSSSSLLVLDIITFEFCC